MEVRAASYLQCVSLATGRLDPPCALAAPRLHLCPLLPARNSGEKMATPLVSRFCSLMPGHVTCKIPKTDPVPRTVLLPRPAPKLPRTAPNFLRPPPNLAFAQAQKMPQNETAGVCGPLGKGSSCCTGVAGRASLSPRLPGAPAAVTFSTGRGGSTVCHTLRQAEGALTA